MLYEWKENSMLTNCLETYKAQRIAENSTHLPVEFGLPVQFSHFYHATHMHSAGHAVARCPSVCLSVCPSHAGIESKQLHISSKFFNCQVASLFYFSHTKRDGDIPTGTSLMGVPNARGYEKIMIFDQYLTISGK